MPDAPRLSFREVAVQVAAENPPVGDDWPTVGARPHTKFRNPVQRAGWPVSHPVISLPANTVSGRGSGRMVDTTVMIVPVPWLRRATELAGRRWPEMCIGIVDGR